MTTGDEGHEAEAAPRAPLVRKRTADFIKARPAAQKVGALGAVVLLASAPFGGLEAVQTPTQTLEQATPYDIGPMEVSITSVSSVPTLAPALAPQPGNRLLVIRMSVQNISDQPTSASQLSSAMSGSGVGAVPFAGQEELEPAVLNVEDGQRISVINPGVTYDAAVVLEQAGDWEPGDVELAITEFVFQASDPAGADPASWRLGTEQLVGDFDVRVRS